MQDSKCWLYGRGAYFAERALYAHTSYAHRVAGPSTTYQLILAHVLCGKEQVMGAATDRALATPPPGFHSIRGGPHKHHRQDADATGSDVWAVYDTAQSYPAYIITYKSNERARLR